MMLGLARVLRSLVGLLRYRGVQIALLVGLIGGAAFWGYSKYRDAQQARVVAEIALAGEVKLANSTHARLTHAEQGRQELLELNRAAQELNGRLVAALKIAVERRDTTITHVALPTTIGTDSTRRATFRDSTFAGVIDGTVIAPPTGPLGINYTLTRPAFTPEVGFVEVGDSMVAVVRWGDERFQIAAPYWKPQGKQLGGLGGFVEGNLLGSQALQGRGGALVRVGSKLRGQVGVQHTLGERLGLRDLFVGFRYEW